MHFDERSYKHSTHPFIPPELGRLPSVTTICGIRDKSGPLMNWAVNVEREAIRAALRDALKLRKEWDAETLWTWVQGVTTGMKEAQKLKDEAADIGSRVHSLIQQTTKGIVVDISQDKPEVQFAMSAFQSWAHKVDLQMVDSEQVVFSRTHRYAGTLDMVAWVDGDLTLLDFKSSNRLYNEHIWQLAAYAEAYEESRPLLYGSTGKQLRKLIVLRLSKVDGSFEPHDVTTKRQTALQAFLGLKTCYDIERSWSGHGLDRKPPVAP